MKAKFPYNVSTSTNHNHIYTTKLYCTVVQLAFFTY